MPQNLYNLDKTVRHFLAAFLFLLSAATLTGLIFVTETTAMDPGGIQERYNGSAATEDEFDIPENYPKSLTDLLLNTHNHLFGFSLIFLSVGALFYFNSTISGAWKYVLLVEPFFSVFLTFGGLWLMRFVHAGFVYLVFIAALATYAAFFIMVGVLFYELLLKQSSTDQ